MAVINSFLVKLTNTASAPTNPSSTTGDIVWPSPYTVITYTADEQRVRQLLFAGCASDLQILLTAIQLVWLVDSSVLSPYLVKDDQRITYTDGQLLGQYASATYDKQHTTQLLRTVPDCSNIFTDAYLREVYGATYSPLDRLAAVVCHFGTHA